jgi:8-oxo-dGTP pyrophosphatase MutT (NUDIX family)
MKKVAKLVIVDSEKRYLLMYRNNHPVFGNDPDLPGGTLEEGESTVEAMVREVQEEIGFLIDKDKTEELYAGAEYSRRGTHYSLFLTVIDERPKINMSWEHTSYEWLEREDFLAKAKVANDRYMRMAYDVLSARDAAL